MSGVKDYRAPPFGQQSAVDDALRPVVRSSIVDGRLIEGVRLAAGDNLIEHKLGRAYRGWSIVGGGTTTVSASASGGSGSSPLIRKWNETDTSEFTLLQATTGLTGSLSVVAVNGRNVLRATISGTYSGTEGFVAWRFGAADAPSRYEFRSSAKRSVQISGSDTLYAGALLMATGTGGSLYGLTGAVFDSTDQQYFFGIEAGVITFSAPLDLGVGAARDADVKSRDRWIFETQSPVVTSPKFVCHYHGESKAASGMSQFGTNYEGDISPAFSGWNGKTLNTVGICMVVAASSGTANNSVDFSDIELWQHPMDVSASGGGGAITVTATAGVAEATSPDASKLLKLNAAAAQTVDLWVF